MLRFNVLICILLLLAGSVFLYFPILKLNLHTWREPLFVWAHLGLSGFFMIWMMRFRRSTTAFWCAGLWAWNPWLVMALAKSEFPFYFYIVYGAVFAILIAVGRWYEQFLVFLKNQEPIVSWLVRIACGALLVGLALMTKDTAVVFKSENKLWEYRANANPNAFNLVHSADEMIKSRDVTLMKTAEAMYQKAIERQPKDVIAYLRLAGLMQNQSRFKEAMSILKQAIAVSPTESDPYLSLAQIYVHLDQAKAVIELFNRLQKILPENEGVYVRMIALYSKAVQDHPHEVIYQEKREELLADYEQIIKRKKYTAADYFKLGFLYEQVGGFDEAVRYYTKAIELSPNHQQALYNLANRYQQMGNFKQAVIVYERLIRYYPTYIAAYLNMGIIYNAMGNTEKAKYLYEKVIRMDPNRADAYFHLGYLYESAGNLKEALNNYEKAVEYDPKHAEAYYNIGNVYASMEQYPEAIASYLKTVGISANHVNAYINLSILSFKSRDFKGAIDYLETAQKLGYTPPEEYLKSLEPYRQK